MTGMTEAAPLMTAARGDLGLLARLRHPGAWRWYAGGSIGLAYQAFEVIGVWTSPTGSLSARTVATIALAAYYAAYLLVPPLVWPEREAVRIGAILGLLALSAPLFALVDLTAVWTWLLVLCAAAFTWSSQTAGLVLTGVVSLLALAIAALAGFPDSISAAPWITASVGILMVAFGHQVRQTVQLRAANKRIALLAVDEERARFARDLHDSLGHSLTVVTVKSELAGKLVARDPDAARAEIADVERLAREALADLRAAVGGFRGVTLEGELDAAREALAAGGIALEVPTPAAVVRPELRPVFAWAVREGVTNVLRHSGAETCTIALSRTAVRIRDDGGAVAPAAPGVGSGAGLRGLAERAAAAGVRVEAGPRAAGGFELRVQR
ncbi:two-component system sensor histidine kinase DesK [Amnibacterium kyonggiense]|uniref:Two-component system sensor histidine kinase DesK n=2 Tax=Amnibacterium kyonggiense TaxID=595671 RepID=A0A4R7FR33_9MICO|nr:two-component system sensor histidine kinase DesK [Amnibacterium kyonggiense]